ncbi:12959_t:CDS:2, partial [Gigaspora margarita]
CHSLEQYLGISRDEIKRLYLKLNYAKYGSLRYLHRDLHPGNIMLKENYEAYITDQEWLNIIERDIKNESDINIDNESDIDTENESNIYIENESVIDTENENGIDTENESDIE